MSNYRQPDRYGSQPYADTLYGPYPLPSAQQGIVGQLSDFTRRQPLLVIGAALLGGLLLARYMTNQGNSHQSQGYQEGYRPMWSYAPPQAASPARTQPAHARRPAAHMGATEDQMSRNFAKPTAQELEQGAKGTTGTVYDLDPGSITAG